jgi:hypothetical protein
MTRTSPVRPVDVEAVFPEVAAFRRSAVRLHPRAGTPGARDSSLGGPVLWPRPLPWPRCEEVHPATALSPQAERPIPLVPVLQLFAMDVPELPFPAGTDMLQVMWCPFDHEPAYAPRPEVFWRDSTQGDLEPADPPRPADAPDDYLPRPCVLHPERVTDYPSWDLPRDIADALQPRFKLLKEETGWSYHHHLSASDGIKIGGYPTWTQDPAWPDCPACGQRMAHLLTINSAEFDGKTWRTWLAVEDTPTTGTIWDVPFEERTRIQRAPGLMIGDMGGVYLFECQRCPGRPFAYHSDCS